MDAERRQVTVLFTDMVGFTSFSERAGEEAAFTLMRSLSKLMDDAVREQGGVVHGFTGDGIMAVFGAPVAFEDAPLRACRASVSILQRLKAAGPDLEAKHGVQPQLRIGLNTGSAVVGQVQQGADAGVTVLGDTVNFAARLQSLAAPSSVYMSEATHRLLQGLVDASFAGEHIIKGKSEPQKAYRLDSIRQGATRFEAAIGRGLSTYVGREREMEVLERSLVEARSQLHVIDVVAEPGMGKSRLLHEFRQRISKDRAFILSASCSPDGQQTPFLPFIEVVRGSFQVSAGEAEKEVARKLELGLTVLGLNSLQNLGLLLSLLGLKAPDGALTGLDGVLIGLRTRDLLQQLLEARCRLSPVVMLIEDLHWIDSVSEEVLGKIVAGETQLQLLLLHTRRPEYDPAWLGRPMVTKLLLEPLPAGDIRRLVEARLGVEALPEALARQVAEKAEGNALFAEEIVSFLLERGVVRKGKVGIEYDGAAVAAALPASLQSLLTARVDRLAPQDRELLQAASVIGRRFDPDLLVAVAEDAGDIDARLSAMRSLDLVHPEGRSGDYTFKHALVRDALYQSLLTGPRIVLHLNIAEEIERRSGNRLTAVVEALAHHYGQTDRANKAFAYLAMAGAKSLGVYSLDEAQNHFNAAVAILDKNPDCASDQQVAEFLVDYTLLLSALGELRKVVNAADKYASRLVSLGDNAQTILIVHHKVMSLVYMGQFRAAKMAQEIISPMADRLGDDRSRAYSLAGEIQVSTVIAPKSIQEFETLSRSALDCASRTNDVYIRSYLHWIIAMDEIHRGRVTKARSIAEETSAIGRQLNDPRPVGVGLGVLGWVALTSEDYGNALTYAQECLRIALTPQDRMTASPIQGAALVLLRKIEAGEAIFSEARKELSALEWRWSLGGVEPIFGVLTILKGQISRGIRIIENAMAVAHQDGWSVGEDWARLLLCGVYLDIISPSQPTALAVVLRNLPVLLRIKFTGSSKILALVEHIRNNPQFDPNGHHIGRCETILGLLYKAKKKRALAVQHLTEAKRIEVQFGPTPMLARIDAALAELR